MTDFQFGEFNEENAVEQAQLDMSPRDVALRDLFVTEYLVDFDHIAAAMRCGFNFELGQKWGVKLLHEAYVQQQIQRISMMRMDPDAEEEFNKQWIMTRLRQEAAYKGPGSSHGARVAALTKLSGFYGMDKVKPTGPGQSSGVVELPATAEGDDWEKQAIGSQQKLMQDAEH